MKSTLSAKVIPIWLMVFDQDPSRTYIFTNKQKVFASVEGLVRSVAPEERAEECVRMALAHLENAWNAPFIPMRFQQTSLFVHRLEIDRYNPIHKMLTNCRAALESTSDPKAAKAIKSIDELFADPL